MAVSIRRLGTEDLAAYREVRLAALRDAPEAFGSTFEKEATLTEDDWRRRLETEDRAVFVVDDAGMILGLAVGSPDEDDPGAGYLLSMWVDPRARGSGRGDALVQAVVGWLEAGRYRLIRLHVTDGNATAVDLYRRNGFALSGRQFRRDRDGVLELEMIRPIETGSRPPDHP